MTEEVTDVHVKDALKRIGASTDGRVLYLYLQKVRMGITPDSAPERALPVNEGRRSFAADLMAFMAEGIESGRDACITFAVAKPAAVADFRGARRRVTADTFVAGWDGPADPEPATGQG